ncbi:hypothetical protein [Tanticharoenia sakaeratensis]|uniref:Phage protein n=1 Tax=Tanticharoenia sakaeratensis NBRC 103193 TaxID=1231623 RepID=A0A0D6MNF0_9PROT|nr:hypothetical protein [Tanticharoenia sakaeratensis]GAN55214.1 hypothetical protein Tasa_041_009 [Tanticharoenia sakaeratensis NBRC 103193]GBQ23260.1 hypothetical protein AA103193_2352 [Tanticharoenia sakaeratensis NBRC 103193]
MTDQTNPPRTRDEQIEKMVDIMRSYRLLYTKEEDNDPIGYPLIDALTYEGGTVDIGVEECGELAAELYDSVITSFIREAKARGRAEALAELRAGAEPVDALTGRPGCEWCLTITGVRDPKRSCAKCRRKHPPVAREAELAAWSDVRAERERQKMAEGWTEAHDDQYSLGELASAASAYAYSASATPSEANILGGVPPVLWPWDRTWWKPTTPRRDLIKAAALILAEIERIDRAALAAAPEKRDV